MLPASEGEAALAVIFGTFVYCHYLIDFKVGLLTLFGFTTGSPPLGILGIGDFDFDILFGV